MAACRSSSENSGKMSLILVFNKNSPRAHTESELYVLGVHGKLVKYVVHSSKRKKLRKNYFSSHKLPKQQSTSFWSQGILGINPGRPNAFAEALPNQKDDITMRPSLMVENKIIPGDPNCPKSNAL
jgi:hypothetical protein